MKVKKAEHLLFWLFSGIVFLILIIKAWYSPPVMDEATSFVDYIATKKLLPFGKGYMWSPNNHFLNTILAFLFSKVFGNDIFVLRIPNLLAFIPFSYWLFGLGRMGIPNRWTRYLFWAACFASAYMIEFFGLFRGYGLSFAFLTGSVYYLIQFGINRATKHAQKVVLCLVLALFANVGLLYTAGLAFLLLLFWGWKDLKKPGFLFALLLLLIAQLAAFAYGLALREEQQLYGTVDFFEIFKSWGDMLTTIEYRFIWVLLGGLSVVMTSVPLIRPFLLRHKANDNRYLASWVVTFFYAGNLLLSILAFWLFEAPFPFIRTSLHIYLFFLLFAGMFSSGERLLTYFSNVGLAAMLALFVYNDTQEFKIDRSVDINWALEQIDPTFWEALSKPLTPDDPLGILGVMHNNYTYEASYMQLTEKSLKGFGHVHQFNDHPSNMEDYLIVNKHQKGWWGFDDYQEVARDQYNLVYLLKRKQNTVRELLLTVGNTQPIDTEKEFLLLGSDSLQIPKAAKALQIDYHLNIKSKARKLYGLVTLEMLNKQGKTVDYRQLFINHLGIFEDELLKIDFPIVLYPLKDEWSAFKTYLWNTEQLPYQLEHSEIKVFNLKDHYVP